MRTIAKIAGGMAVLAALTAGGGAAPGSAAAQSRQVTINRVALNDAEIAGLERQYRIRILDGDYWYDGRAGLWVIWGGPVVGLAVPGLQVGGPLPRQASGGRTGVFVNGREVHADDVKILRTIMQVWPGRYWMDASGWGGFEGGPPLWNVWHLAAQAKSGGRGDRSWIYRGIGGGMGGDGECTYAIWGSSSASVGCG